MGLFYALIIKKMEEQWKPVVGYEGLYEVSNLGRVKSLKGINDRILKPTTTNKGYYIVALYKNKIKSFKTIHRLVLISFVGKPVNGQECDHCDRNRKNNIVNNLKWVSKNKNLLNRNGWGKPSNLRGVCKEITNNKNGSIRIRLRSQITINKKTINLGYHKTEEVAHEAYKQAYLNHYGYEWMG